MQESPLSLLRQCAEAPSSALRIVVVAAHPDDETIGAGARLSRWAGVHIVHVTDGAPRDMIDANRLGLSSRAEYVRVRRAERAHALAVAGLDGARIHDLERVDQEAARDLPGIAIELTALFNALRADVIVTHAYEGGHPDHDATAFAVHAAASLLARNDRRTPVLLEMTSYHAGPKGMATGCFLQPTATPAVAAPLGEEQRIRKRTMLDCYTSQSRTLRAFSCDTEPLRIAPTYGFGLPPHAGRLFYEQFDWGTTGPEWRAQARGAARVLGLATLVA